MLKSTFTTAIRNIFRHGSFSLINLIGLAVSMSLGMLIIMIIKEQYTFDDFHKDSERIYRVNTRALRTNGETEPYASTPLPLGKALIDDYAFAEEVVSITRAMNSDALVGSAEVPVRGLIVDPAFLRVFEFPLQNGDVSTALQDAKSLVLTRACAEKIFGKVDALGRAITIKGFGDFTITGILKEFPSKTHFEFEMLASSDGLAGWEKAEAIPSVTNLWTNYYSSYTYFKLKKGRTLNEVQNALAEISKKYYANVKPETRDKGYEFYLQSINDITPGPQLSNQMGNALPSLISIFIAALATVVIIMACLNYTNLMIAKSLARAKEIGVRKVMGAQRWQVFVQFVGETIIFAVFALILSYGILQLLKPAFMQLHITREFSVTLHEDLATLGMFFIFALVVGMIAGLLPAGYLSAFQASRVLKDAGNLRVYSRLSMRQILMVVQFTFSIIFIVFVLIVQSQVNFMINKDYGINEKNILNVQLQGLPYEKLANELRSVRGVVQIAGISHPLGTWRDRSDDFKKSPDGELFGMRDFIVDENYLNNIDARFVAGRNFREESNGTTEKHIILNEQALKVFGFADAVSAIGQPVYTADSLTLEVIGVVKDFNFRPLSYQIGPVAFRCDPSKLSVVSARIAPGERDHVVAHVEAIWKRLDPSHPLIWKMMDQEIDDAYEEGGFTDIGAVVGYITFLAIVIACLGMLGMAMYASQTRIREVGIRKVMGASVSEIAFLLSRSFLMMISIALIIGTPVSIFLGQSFLTLYAYKVEITPWLILGGVSIIAGLGLLTIYSQTLRAAAANPVSTLRYE